MKRSLKVILIGLSSGVLASGCVNITVQKDPRAELTKAVSADDIEVSTSVSLEVPDSEVEEFKDEDIDAAPVDVIKDGYVKFDSDKMSTLSVFLEGGSFNFSLRDELASGALVSSDEHVYITGIETDLVGLSCQKLVDEKDVLYGLHCSYADLKGSAGDIHKMRVTVRNGAGFEGEDYVFFELKNSALEVKSEVSMKVASGSQITLSPAQWLKDGVISSSDSMLYIGKYSIDSFKESEKVMDKADQYALSIVGSLADVKVGSTIEGVVVIGDSSKNYVEVKVVLEVISAEEEAASSAEWAIDEKVDSAEVIELKKKMQSILAEVAKEQDSIMSSGDYKPEEQDKLIAELDAKQAAYEKEIRARIETLQPSEKKSEWEVNEKSDSDEVIALKKKMQTIIAKVAAEKESISSSDDYKQEEKDKLIADLDAKQKAYEDKYRARIAELQPAASDDSEWVIDEKADSDEVKALKTEILQIISDYAAKEAEMRKNDASVEELADHAAKLDTLKAKYREAIKGAGGGKSEDAPAPAAEDHEVSGIQMNVIRGSNPCNFQDSTQQFLMKQMVAAIYSVSESSVSSAKLTKCEAKEVDNPTKNINMGWEGLYTFDAVYSK